MNTEHIMIRITPEQKRRLSAKAASLGLPLSTYVRMVACDSVSRLEKNDIEANKVLASRT